VDGHLHQPPHRAVALVTGKEHDPRPPAQPPDVLVHAEDQLLALGVGRMRLARHHRLAGVALSQIDRPGGVSKQQVGALAAGHPAGEADGERLRVEALAGVAPDALGERLPRLRVRLPHGLAGQVGGGTESATSMEKRAMRRWSVKGRTGSVPSEVALAGSGTGRVALSVPSLRRGRCRGARRL